MKMNSHLVKIVLYQHVGFLCIILFCFLDELLRLPSLIFSGHPFAFEYRRSTIEILLVFAVWLLVSNSTRRAMERLRYLEKFMRVCAWCRRINHHGEWMPLEEFMQQGFDTPTTHGICQACLMEQKAAVERARKAREAKAAAAAAAGEK